MASKRNWSRKLKLLITDGEISVYTGTLVNIKYKGDVYTVFEWGCSLQGVNGVSLKTNAPDANLLTRIRCHYAFKAVRSEYIDKFECYLK